MSATADAKPKKISSLVSKVIDQIEAVAAQNDVGDLTKLSMKAGRKSQSTWQSWKSGTAKPTLDRLEEFAEAAGAALDVTVSNRRVLSGEALMVLDGSPSTGGLGLSDHAQRIVMLLRQIPKEHHQFILDVVKDAAEVRGFSQPSAGEEANRSRRK